MSVDTSSKKGKRPRSSSANTSFVKSVTDKVSSLLPARITKWFSSPKSANVNGSVATAEATDSSTDDEDAPVSTQPPSKRIRLAPPGQHSQFNQVETNIVHNSSDVIEPSSIPYSAIQSPPNRSTFQLETSNVSTPIRHANEESFVEQNDQDRNVFKIEHRVSSIGKSVAGKRESIFKTSKHDSFKASPSSYRVHDQKQPYFKPSISSSPFYSGRTMYGGASLASMNQANVKNKKVALVNNSKVNDTATMSNSARTILDLLENYSSPLTEARRIPQYSNNSNTDKINTSGNDSTIQNKSLGYKTQDLYVPRMASILKFKQNLRLTNTTSAARQLIASHSSTIDFKAYPFHNNTKERQDIEEPDTLSDLRQFRLKTKVTRQNRGVDKLTEMTPAINLPTGALQIDPNNLPNFMPQTTPTTTMTNLPTPVSITTSTPITSSGESKIVNWSNKSNNLPMASEYKFSKPDPVSEELQNTTTKSINYQFGSPQRELKDQGPLISVITEKKEKVTTSANFKKDMMLSDMLKEWKCSDCWVSNKPDNDKCVCCGGKRPSVLIEKPIKCYLCKVADVQKNADKCGSCEKTVIKKIDTPLRKPKETVTWKCDDCWVNNNQSTDKCVCCGSKNSKKSVIDKQVTNAPGKDWKCVDCWIMNKDDSEKCIACGGAKTIPQVNSTVTEPRKITGDDTNKNSLRPIKSADNDFINIAKSQKNDKWDCPSCLVRNENNTTSCVCCGVSRTNLKNIEENTKFVFGSKTNTSAKQFKFGIFKNENQETDVDNIMEEESLPEVPKFVDPGNNNTNLAKISTFSHISNKDKTEISKDKEVSTNLQFQFGIPKQLPVQSGPILQLSQPSNPRTEQETAQVVPKIDFGTIEENKQNSLNTFSTPASKTVNTSTINQFLGSGLSAENSATPKCVSSLPTYTTLAVTVAQEVSPNQNAFKFSASKLNLSGNLFTSPVSTATPVTTMSFEMPFLPATTTITAPSVIPMFPKPEINTANSISLFPKKDDVQTTSVPLFQKTPLAVTTVQTTPAPVFSFGSNMQNNAQPSEKPKFNFFSNNATESTTLFKAPTFGTMADSNSESNKFSISSGNTAGAGSGPFGNILGGNALSSGNSLTTITVPRGSLPGMAPLGGSTEVSTNAMSGGNGLQANNTLPIVFGSSAPKDNMWSLNNGQNNTMFNPNTSASTMQKPAPFTFGTASPFNGNNSTSTFGSVTQTVSNIFGMPNQAVGSQSALFSTPGQNQIAPTLFGNPVVTNNSVSTLTNMFGTPNVGATSTFGSPNQLVPTFEAPSLAPAPPAFNFGASQPSNVPSFVQQQPPPVYNFGGGNGGTPQVQFTIGSAPPSTATNPTMRRFKKAVRRNPQR